MAELVIQDILRGTKIYEVSGLSDSRPDGRIPIPPTDEDLLNVDHLLQLAHATPGLDRQVLLHIITLHQSVMSVRLGPPQAPQPAHAPVQVQPAQNGFTPQQLAQLTDLLRPLREEVTGIREEVTGMRGDIRRIEGSVRDMWESINNANTLNYNARIFGHVGAVLRTIKVNGLETPPELPEGMPLTTFAILQRLTDPEVQIWLAFYDIVLDRPSNPTKRKDALWSYITGQKLK